jgi:ABC-type transport system involved in cytochrome bd biosynthesis fused ATPase/permease subunit
MNGTIRENIIFYNTFDKERYNKVINVCQLNEDLYNLEHGDMTEVGSTGNNLSGGQRARISLARAIYKDADIYIFDDPISSVDTYVSMKIFHQGIVNFLKNKTKIFVTHDTRNLKYSQKIIVMNNFNIEFNGSYDEYIKNEKYKQINENKNKDLLNKDITDIDRESFQAKSETFGK